MLKNPYGGAGNFTNEETWKLVPQTSYIINIDKQSASKNYWISSYARIASSSLENIKAPEQLETITAARNSEEKIALVWTDKKSQISKTSIKKVQDIFDEAFPELKSKKAYLTRFLEPKTQRIIEQEHIEESPYYTYNIFTSKIKYYSSLKTLAEKNKLSEEEVQELLDGKTPNINSIKIFKNIEYKKKGEAA